MDVVPDARPVPRRIVLAEDLDALPPSQRHIQHQRDQVRLRLMRLAVPLHRPRHVEVPQARGPQPVDAVEPPQHPLRHQLALAVRIGRRQPRVLRNRRLLRLAVARRRRAEHQPVLSRRQHRLQQSQRPRRVVPEINLRPLHALARLDQRGKVHHSVEPPGPQRLLQQRPVGQLALHKLRALRHRRPPAVAQVVIDRHRVPARQQKPRHRSADIPCTARYQNPHRLSSQELSESVPVLKGRDFRAKPGRSSHRLN